MTTPANPPTDHEAREAAGVHCLACGHRVKWHHDTEGCDYHGRGPHRCLCRLSSDTVARQLCPTATPGTPPLTDTVAWCPTRNAYADPSCGTQGVGVSHGHYDVGVDPLTGAVLTSPEVQALRRRVASYYVAPEGGDRLCLWRGQPGDTRPLLVLRRDRLADHPDLWDHLVAGLRVEAWTDES